MNIDTDKASLLGVTSDQLRNSLYQGFGTNQASTIFKTGNSYDVIVEFDPEIPQTADLLNSVHVTASTGKQIPLSAFAHIERVAGLLSVNLLGHLPAVTISFNLPTGVSLGQATDQIAVIKEQLALPSTFTTSFAGTAQVFQDAAANQGLLLLAAVLTIYIPRHSLRKLHPSPDDPDRPSGRRGRRVADVADLRVRIQRHSGHRRRSWGPCRSRSRLAQAPSCANRLEWRWSAASSSRRR